MIQALGAPCIHRNPFISHTSPSLNVLCLATEQDVLLPHTISEHKRCPEKHRIGEIRAFGAKALQVEAAPFALATQNGTPYLSKLGFWAVR